MTSAENTPSTAQPFLIRFESVTRIFERVLMFLAGASILGLTVLVFGDALARWLSNSPIEGTLEIVSYVLMPISIFGAYSYAHSKNQHISMTLIRDQVTGRGGVMNSIAIEVATLVAVGMMFIYGLSDTAYSMELGEANINLITVPIWPAKIFMSIGLAAFMLRCLVRLITSIHEFYTLRAAEGKVAKP